MAIVMNMRWKGVTPEQFDTVRKLVNYEGDSPTGGIVHVVSFDADGVRITDVWNSAEEFQAFVETRLNPGVAKVGLLGQPEVEIAPLHLLFTPAFVAKS